MRIYELSKELEIQNKDLLEFFEEKNIFFKSHMSVLSDEEEAAARSFFSKSSLGEPSSQVLSEGEVEFDDEEGSSEEEVRAKHAKKAKPKLEVELEVPAVFVEKNSKPFSKYGALDQKAAAIPGIVVREMMVGDFAQAAHVQASDVILSLLRQGIVRTKNQRISAKEVEMLAQLLSIPVVAAAAPEKAVAHATGKIQRTATRLPIVVVVGHVDHGKTTLLDYIRSARVAAREKGGITQHLGAYQVATKHGGLVFLDTPGHEAFSNIRGRGIKVADIAILIVAADDGIMPQTIEAIKTAQEAQLPIVVAINKIDKVAPAAIDRIKQTLSDYNLMPEEWGGTTTVMPISAKEGTGVDSLLEALVLQSQVMDLQADPAQAGFGYVLESRLDKGRGPVATVICQTGTVRIGDYFAAGDTYGRVSSIVDSAGKSINEAGPSVPVRIGTFSELPLAGNYFEIISFERYKKIKSAPVERKKKINMHLEGVKSVPVVLKVDTVSTLEALEGAIKKLQHRLKKQINVIHSGVGDITESDIMTAANAHALVCGLHVKVQAKAQEIAQKHVVVSRLYEVIYKLLEDLEELGTEQEVKIVLKKIGEAEVRKVFEIKNIGVVAGSYVKDGRFTRDGIVVGWRGKEKLGEGKIKSLQRDRNTVKEVHAGFEFAFFVEEIDSWQIGDRAECFIKVQEKSS
jgi:translation initiation factor IF-2